MSTSSISTARRVGVRLVDPAAGLLWTWIATFAVLVIGVRGAPLVVFVFAIVSFLVGQASMLLVAATMPPPAKLTELSALASLVFGFIKVVWSSFVFAAGAVYGAYAGMTLSALGANNGGYNPVQQLIWPVVVSVATAVGQYALMACAFDLWRAGGVARSAAVERLVGLLPAQARQNAIILWARELVLACTRGWLPWVLGFLAPYMVIMAVQTVPWLTAAPQRPIQHCRRRQGCTRTREAPFPDKICSTRSERVS